MSDPGEREIGIFWLINHDSDCADCFERGLWIGIGVGLVLAAVVYLIHSII